MHRENAGKASGGELRLLFRHYALPGIGSLFDKAPKYFHSTTVDAAQCALEAGAKMLLVGHYSSRVKDREILERECKEIFANSRAVDDGDIIEID